MHSTAMPSPGPVCTSSCSRRRLPIRPSAFDTTPSRTPLAASAASPSRQPGASRTHRPESANSLSRWRCTSGPSRASMAHAVGVSVEIAAPAAVPVGLGIQVGAEARRADVVRTVEHSGVDGDLGAGHARRGCGRARAGTARRRRRAAPHGEKPSGHRSERRESERCSKGASVSDLFVRDNPARSRYELLDDGVVVGFTEYHPRGDVARLPAHGDPEARRGAGLATKLMRGGARRRAEARASYRPGVFVRRASSSTSIPSMPTWSRRARSWHASSSAGHRPICV